MDSMQESALRSQGGNEITDLAKRLEAQSAGNPGAQAAGDEFKRLATADIHVSLAGFSSDGALRGLNAQLQNDPTLAGRIEKLAAQNPNALKQALPGMFAHPETANATITAALKPNAAPAPSPAAGAPGAPETPTPANAGAPPPVADVNKTSTGKPPAKPQESADTTSPAAPTVNAGGFMDFFKSIFSGRMSFGQIITAFIGLLTGGKMGGTPTVVAAPAKPPTATDNTPGTGKPNGPAGSDPKYALTTPSPTPAATPDPNAKPDYTLTARPSLTPAPAAVDPNVKPDYSLVPGIKPASTPDPKYALTDPNPAPAGLRVQSDPFADYSKFSAASAPAQDASSRYTLSDGSGNSIIRKIGQDGSETFFAATANDAKVTPLTPLNKNGDSVTFATATSTVNTVLSGLNGSNPGLKTIDTLSGTPSAEIKLVKQSLGTVPSVTENAPSENIGPVLVTKRSELTFTA